MENKLTEQVQMLNEEEDGDEGYALLTAEAHDMHVEIKALLESGSTAFSEGLLCICLLS